MEFHFYLVSSLLHSISILKNIYTPANKVRGYTGLPWISEKYMYITKLFRIFIHLYSIT